MQYNHGYHLHHQLVDASQMLGKFESFYYNRNVQVWEVQLPPSSSLDMVYRLSDSRKRVFDCTQMS